MNTVDRYANNPVWKFLHLTPELKDYWKPVQQFGPQGMIFKHNTIPLVVIITLPDPDDMPPVYKGETWVHVSCSREDGIPSYMEMATVKRLFIGDDRTAYSVWPKASDHINFSTKALHLWHRVGEEDPLPNFGAEGMI